MSSDDETSAPEGRPESAALFPLLDDDPVKVGDFWLDARVTSTPAGTAFVAHEDGGDATLLMLLSAGAAKDPAARSRFSGEINAMHIDTVVARGGQDQDEGLMQVRFRGEEDDPTLDGHAPLAPWVALAFDGSAAAAREAEREAKASRARTPRHEKSFFEKLTENTMVRQMARSAAREITRSIFGTGRRR